MHDQSNPPENYLWRNLEEYFTRPSHLNEKVKTNEKIESKNKDEYAAAVGQIYKISSKITRISKKTVITATTYG